MAIGVYMIVNTANNTVYIGSTSKSFEKRWREHKNDLKANRHPNIHLQRAYNRDGEAGFDYDVLEETDDTIEAEDFWIQYFRGIGAKLYNLAPVAGSCRGIKRKPRTKEWRENQSALMKERMQDESLRNHINDGRQSYWSKEESKEAAAKRMKERMDNPEYKAKVSWKGKVHSEETKVKMREAALKRWSK